MMNNYEELREAQFNRVIDDYLVKGFMLPESYAQCTTLQKQVIQVIKRAFKRTIKR